MCIRYFLLLLAVATVHLSFGQEKLGRRAYWGIEFETDASGVRLRTVSEKYAFGVAGLQNGDVVTHVNGSELKLRSDLGAALRGKLAGDVLKVRYLRNGKAKQAILRTTPFPYEETGGVAFEYGSFITEQQDHLRTIVSKPSGEGGKQPAILFLQWLSCDAIDQHPMYKDGNIQLIHDLSRAGFLVMRTEKPGVGDSQGRSCSQYGFNDELDIHRQALQQLRKRPDVDLSRIFLFGSSIGGTMAPILAQGEDIRGLLVTGCYYKTWYEHMLEIERRISFLSGDSPGATNKKMKLWSRFYSMYLNEGMTPGKIISKYPEFKEVWEGPDEHQYGRPVSFYIEANNHNVPEYWQALNIPALVIYGTYDYIMSREDHVMIVDALNRKKEGLGTYLEVEGMDHGLTIYKSQQAAFTSFSSKYDTSLTDKVIRWLEDQSR